MKSFMKLVSFLVFLPSCSVSYDGGETKVPSLQLIPPEPAKLFIGENFRSIIGSTAFLVGVPEITSVNLPKSASLTSRGDGTATFSWQPSPDQVGEYLIEFQASAGGEIDAVTWRAEVVNRLPVVSEVTINDENFVTSIISAVAAGIADLDSGQTVILHYQWFVNGVALPEGTTENLAAPHFMKGDVIYVEISPFDGLEYGQQVRSKSVSILNTPPTIEGVTTGNGPYDVTSTLTTGIVALNDVDASDTVVPKYQWFVNGVQVPGGTMSSLTGAFIRGDNVYSFVTPNDGSADGMGMQSPTFVIGNADPVVTTASLDGNLFRKGDVISGLAFGSDADGDIPTFTFRWYLNAVYVSSGSSFAGSFAKGDTVAAEIVPFDGTSHGTRYWTEPISIQDTLPNLVNITLGAGPFYKPTLLTAGTTVEDVDGDPVIQHYRWFVDGLEVAGQITSGLSGVFAKGQTVAVEVTPEAASAFGNPSWSNTVTISNSIPAMTSVIFGAGPYYRDSTISATATAVDADGDTVSFSYRWFVDGALINEATGSSFAGVLEIGNLVSLEVTPHADGVTGPSLVSEDITISNRVPSTPGVSIYPEFVSSSSSQLWADVITDSTDPDGDVITYSYSWYFKNILQNFPSSQTLITSLDIKGGAWQVLVTPSDTWNSGISGIASKLVYSQATRIFSGFSHNCALNTAGGIKCWGFNDKGQLGIGNINQQNTPVDVSGLTSGIQAVAPGETHTCALTTGGGVKCWGYNATYQLGNGGTTTQWAPVDTSGLSSGVKEVITGRWHTCVLTIGGGVKCWGYGANGQLGNGGTSTRSVPVAVTGMASGVTAITSQNNHTCALTTGGGAKCWGENDSGQVGNGSWGIGGGQLTPVDVTGLGSGVKALLAGIKHTCALTTLGGVKCWGWGTYGQIGNGLYSSRQLTPVDVTGLESGVQSIAVGGIHTCALTTEGGVKCWGLNDNGQLGDGSTLQAGLPVDVSGLSSGIRSISAGKYDTCALTNGGGVRCWGLNSNGQLGINSVVQSLVPNFWLIGFVPQ